MIKINQNKQATIDVVDKFIFELAFIMFLEQSYKLFSRNNRK
jgi:hypothetical protein